jgi:hypothetical protein
MRACHLNVIYAHGFHSHRKRGRSSSRLSAISGKECWRRSEPAKRRRLQVHRGKSRNPRYQFQRRDGKSRNEGKSVPPNHLQPKGAPRILSRAFCLNSEGVSDHCGARGQGAQVRPKKQALNANKLIRCYIVKSSRLKGTKIRSINSQKGAKENA